MLLFQSEILIVHSPVLSAFVPGFDQSVYQQEAARVVLSVVCNGFCGLAQFVDCSEHATEITVQHIFNFCRIKVNRSFCIWVSARSFIHGIGQSDNVFIGALIRLCPFGHIFVVRCVFIKWHTRPTLFCNVGFPQGFVGTRYKGIQSSAALQEINR